MDICRFALHSYPLYLPPLSILIKPAIVLPSSSSCHSKLAKFAQLSLIPSKPTIYTRVGRASSYSSSASSSMEAPPEGYRRNVGICLINDSKKIFAASRLDIPDSWQMPQGGIDEGEDPRAAAIRELREETGVLSAEILSETPHWLTYDFPPEVRAKLQKQWGSDWKGQAQKWFLFKFTGKDEEVNLLGDGSEKPEFGEWSWISPEQVVDLAVDFKKPVYKEVLAVFAPYF
ncbi:PREDICTED: nudix hydrolase 26, chloroplastic-like [Fragaria vesca subsp. vesca]|uniref:nudix hydrolase 26, chloroplastic-like n=1 Tax=Fragaria vesca subsp. vesca TaxID=101020 RepID=UPI0002C330BB|nr:PREDICTED: nudix hydrolase 26, chloroplastic-like [Fragaria vesca subsp. vesca]XP_011468301.1 PREDICTED: nudix hydrolase 26, chloroplastic-like [Fragaria vesca subsp. vesca]